MKHTGLQHLGITDIVLLYVLQHAELALKLPNPFSGVCFDPVDSAEDFLSNNDGRNAPQQVVDAISELQGLPSL